MVMGAYGRDDATLFEVECGENLHGVDPRSVLARLEFTQGIALLTNNPRGSGVPLAHMSVAVLWSRRSTKALAATISACLRLPALASTWSSPTRARTMNTG